MDQNSGSICSAGRGGENRDDCLSGQSDLQNAEEYCAEKRFLVRYGNTAADLYHGLWHYVQSELRSHYFGNRISDAVCCNSGISQIFSDYRWRSIICRGNRLCHIKGKLLQRHELSFCPCSCMA